MLVKVKKKMKLNEPGQKAEIRMAEFLATDKACAATFLPTVDKVRGGTEPNITKRKTQNTRGMWANAPLGNFDMQVKPFTDKMCFHLFLLFIFGCRIRFHFPESPPIRGEILPL